MLSNLSECTCKSSLQLSSYQKEKAILTPPLGPFFSSMRAGSHPHEAISRWGRWWEISLRKAWLILGKDTAQYGSCALEWSSLGWPSLSLWGWPSTLPTPTCSLCFPLIILQCELRSLLSFPSRLWQREPGVFLLRGEQGVVDLEICPFFISVGTGSIHRDHKLIHLQKGHLFKWLTAEVVRPSCLDFS